MTMMMNDVRDLVETRSNFIYAKRFDNSLKKLLVRYPDGVPDRIIAQALLVTEEELERMWENIIQKLRKSMGVDLSML